MKIIKSKSILPNSSEEVRKPKEGKTGVFETIWNEELDMHILYYTPTTGSSCVLATHHNGYSCDSLARRCLGGDICKALTQLNYIRDCGGLICSESFIKDIVEKEKK